MAISKALILILLVLLASVQVFSASSFEESVVSKSEDDFEDDDLFFSRDEVNSEAEPGSEETTVAPSLPNTIERDVPTIGADITANTFTRSVNDIKQAISDMLNRLYGGTLGASFVDRIQIYNQTGTYIEFYILLGVPTSEEMINIASAELNANPLTALSGYLVNTAPINAQRHIVINVTQDLGDVVCFDSSDCSNQGSCTSGGCACWSGFGDAAGSAHAKCASVPSNTCTFNVVNGSQTSFAPTYAVDVSGGIFKFTISSPLDQNPLVNPSIGNSSTMVDSATVGFSQDTQITWDNTNASSICNYPHRSGLIMPFWTKLAASTSSCQDSYALTLGMSIAKNRCGFVYDSASMSWKNKITIKRRYSIPFNTDFKRDTTAKSVDRYEVMTFDVSVVFPGTVVTESNTTVSGAVASYVSAVTNLQYIPSSSQWQLQIQSFTRAPYRLSNPVASWSTGISRVVSATSADVSGCSSNTQSCSQLFTVMIDGCQSIDAINKLKLSVLPICSGAANLDVCAPITQPIDIITTLSSQSSCNATDTVEFVNKSLISYKKADFATVATDFKASQVAYFAATLQSTDSVISNRTLNSVCIVMDPTGNNDPCHTVAFTLLASNGTVRNPAFSINLAQTRYLTNDTAAHAFTIRASISVVWKEAYNRRSEEVIEHHSTSLAATSILVSADEPESSVGSASSSDAASTSSIWKVAAITMGGLLAAVVVVGIIAGFLYRVRASRVSVDQS